MTTRALLYARQSMARIGETADTSLSLDAQIARCTEYAAKSGWEIVHIERDHDLKGADPTRPGIAALLDWAQSGRCDVCGVGTRLQMHHIDNDPSNNSPENIQTLCISCHASHHHRARAAGRAIAGKAA